MARVHLIDERTPQRVRDSLRSLRMNDNDADIIRLRLREDIDAILNDVRRGPDVTEDMTTQELLLLTASNIGQDWQSLQDDLKTLRDWQEGDPDRTPRASAANLAQRPPQMARGLMHPPARYHSGLTPILLPSSTPSESQIARSAPFQFARGQGGAAAGRPQQRQLPGLRNSGPQQYHGSNAGYGNPARVAGHQRGPRFGGHRGGSQNPRGGNQSGWAGPNNAQQGQVLAEITAIKALETGATSTRPHMSLVWFDTSSDLYSLVVEDYGFLGIIKYPPTIPAQVTCLGSSNTLLQYPHKSPVWFNTSSDLYYIYPPLSASNGNLQLPERYEYHVIASERIIDGLTYRRLLTLHIPQIRNDNTASLVPYRLF
ncbi:MAG: hypothetical protein Q9200_006421 [Gallowayella weberi]